MNIKECSQGVLFWIKHALAKVSVYLGLPICIAEFFFVLINNGQLVKTSEVYCNAKVNGTLIVKFTQPFQQ
jgi:hypothetical protein